MVGKLRFIYKKSRIIQYIDNLETSGKNYIKSETVALPPPLPSSEVPYLKKPDFGVQL